MERSKGSTSSLSASRSASKRSSANLSNLRLAPLSAKFVEFEDTPQDDTKQSFEGAFARSHSSYLQGRSAPTTPGILSRSSSRRQLHGLSRRSSVYDNEPREIISYEYSGAVSARSPMVSAETRSGRMPKAMSEAALLVQKQRAMKSGVRSPEERRQRHHVRRSTGTGGSTTPRAKRDAEDNWILRTGMAANAIVQESKGQSWMTSRSSSSSFLHGMDNSDADDDEGYEEMAALSASTTRGNQADDELTPVVTRTGAWGSRYGSRNGSRRTSRRGSITGGQSSLAPLTAVTTDGSADLADDEYGIAAIVPDFVDSEEELDSQDEAVVANIVEGKTFGFGGIVDRLMNFNLFKVEEKEETTDDEVLQDGAPSRAPVGSSAAQMSSKKLDQSGVKNDERKERGDEGGWSSDAAWLVNVAAKVMF